MEEIKTQGADKELSADELRLQERLATLLTERQSIEGVSDYSEALAILGWEIAGDDSGVTSDNLRAVLDSKIAETEIEIELQSDFLTWEQGINQY